MPLWGWLLAVAGGVCAGFGLGFAACLIYVGRGMFGNL